MMLLFFVVAIAFPVHADAPRTGPLIGVLPRTAVPQQSFLCPCEFDLGVHIDGETGLIIDRNGDGQRAYANIDGSIVELKNAVPFKSECKPGELVTGAWKTAGVTLKLWLITDRDPGEESCWFRGLMTVEKGSRGATRKVVGACGC